MTDTPQFSRQSDTNNLKPYQYDPFENKQGLGRPPRPYKQTVEPTVLVQENFQIENYLSGKENKSNGSDADNSPNPGGSIIMGLLKQMVEASNLNESVLKKDRTISNDTTSYQMKLREKMHSNSIVKEEEVEDDEDEEEEDLEPPKTETLPFRIQKIVNTMNITPNHTPGSVKQNRSRSPTIRNLSRTKIPKPSKQEAFENTYKTSLESIKNRYANALVQKKNKECHPSHYQNFDTEQGTYFNKENTAPNISPEQIGKIKRQRADNVEESARLMVSPTSLHSCEQNERDERENNRMERENNRTKKRYMFNVFSIKLEEISRIENLKKDMRQTDYFNKILFDSAPMGSIEQFAQEIRGNSQFTQERSRLEIIRAIDFFQLYHHTSYLREIYETRCNIKKILESIEKLKQDNKNFIEAVHSAETLNKKQIPRKPIKEINVQENETKIVLLQEIASRMTQKVVVLVLKYLRAARILRENLIEKTQKHFELLACHRSLAALYQYKRLQEEKRKVQAIAIERVAETRKKLIWNRWVKFTKHYNLKHGQAAQVEDFNSRRLLKKAFQALSSQKASKEILDAALSLAHGYSDRIRLARCFYGIQAIVGVAKKTSALIKRDIDYKNKEFQILLKQKLAKAHREAKRKMLAMMRNKGVAHSSPAKKIKSIIHQPNTPVLKNTSTPSKLNLIMASLNKSRKTQELTEKDELNNLSLFEKALQYKRTKYGNSAPNSELITEIREHVVAMIVVYKTLLRTSLSQSTHRSQPLRVAPQDIDEAEEVLTQRHRRRQLVNLFTKWKLAFLERWLEIELDLLHTMNFSRRIMTSLKVFLARKADDERYNTEIAEYNYLSTLFKGWRRASDAENSQKIALANICYTKRFFKQWQHYSEYQKNKHHYYEDMLKRHQRGKLERILAAWNEQSKKNYEILRIWRKRLRNREVLKKFFTLMFDVAETYKHQTPPARSNFQLLYNIMRAWRNEVIENENTFQQKIDRLTAINHFNNHQKYKAFRGWKRILRYLKAFPILIKNTKSNLSKNVFKKWHDLTSTTQQALEIFEKEKHIRFLQKYFDRIKTFNLQEKLIRAFNVKRFFLAWRASHELNRVNFPKKYYLRSLLRKSFYAMKLYRIERIKSMKRSFTATQLEKQKRFRLERMVMYCLIENAIKQKTKNLLQQRGIGFRVRFLKRRAILGLKDYVYQQRVKKEKTLIALNFRKTRRCLTLRIGSHFKMYQNPKDAASLLLSAWRAIALRAKNTRILANRFMRARKRDCLRRYFVEWHEEYLKVYDKPLLTPSFRVDLEKYLPTKIENMQQSIRYSNDLINRSQSDASTHDISRMSLNDSRNHTNENYTRKFQVSQIRETKNFQK